MNIHIASDHAGFELKEFVKKHLSEKYNVIDHGNSEYDPNDDYPLFCIECGRAVTEDPGSLGIVIGGSGNGEQIAANKVKGIRAILAWSIETARLGREHNNANIISIGARMHPSDASIEFINTFLATPFSKDARHIRRINELYDFENL
jgi:ribose 5-phosphate isomerase B